MSTSVEDLMRQLDAHRDTYRELTERLQEALAKRAAVTDPNSPSTSSFPPPARRSTISIVEPEKKPSDFHDPNDLQEVPSLFHSSALSVDSESDADESYYVQTPLPPKSHHHEHVRTHLKEYQWDEYGRKVLGDLIDDHTRLIKPSLFNDQTDEKSKFSHYQVFDVGADGAPLPVDVSSVQQAGTKANAIWHAIKDLNAKSDSQRMAVGRITIAREPSPILFGALHLTMNDAFDMDELFRYLVGTDASFAPTMRPFEPDPRRQRTFVFSFEYYTIIGEDCQPMPWQLADKDFATTEGYEGHIPLSRCSSVVALSLYGEPIRKIRNPHRRASTKHGYVYDPWAPWQVLNIQCYPDWKSRMDTHDSTKHYVNGPEAFLHTLLQEFRDAQKRFEEIYRRITRIITPPNDFIFDPELRDRRLFEDENFTFTRRYFWAHQTLGTMNDSIKAMTDAYEDTFTEDVWEGRHKLLWPLIEEGSARNEHWRKRLRGLQKQFEKEMAGLKMLVAENNDRRSEIRQLRDQLFSGTSVLESRKSVELGEITIQQGHNIKLLTLVNMIFVPLTFVTSVFGMTNMSTRPTYWQFGVVTACVCVPFFLLIGSLNTTTGMRFWRTKTHALVKRCAEGIVLLGQLGQLSRRQRDDASPQPPETTPRDRDRDPDSLRPMQWTKTTVEARERRGFYRNDGARLPASHHLHHHPNNSTATMVGGSAGGGGGGGGPRSSFVQIRTNEEPPPRESRDSPSPPLPKEKEKEKEREREFRREHRRGSSAAGTGSFSRVGSGTSGRLSVRVESRIPEIEIETEKEGSEEGSGDGDGDPGGREREREGDIDGEKDVEKDGNGDGEEQKRQRKRRVVPGLTVLDRFRGRRRKSSASLKVQQAV